MIAIPYKGIAKIFSKRDGVTLCQSEGTHHAWVVWKLDNTIQRINYYPVDSVVCFVHTYQWIAIYPVNSVIQPSNNWGQIVMSFFAIFRRLLAQKWLLSYTFTNATRVEILHRHVIEARWKNKSQWFHLFVYLSPKLRFTLIHLICIICTGKEKLLNIVTLLHRNNKCLIDRRL